MNRRPNRRLLGLLGLGIVVVIANGTGLLNPAKTAVAWVSAPAMGALDHLGTGSGGFFSNLASIQHLAADNQQLKDQVAALRQQISEDAELRAQNAELRQQLSFGDPQADKEVAASVLGYQPDNFRQVITIARGSNNGIRGGMAVIAQGALVGQVSSVTLTTAKVFLIIDPSFRMAALDQDQASRPTGTVHGQIGNGLVMDEIAQNETVKAGDSIITSGLGGLLPKGLIIGRVQTVSKRDNGVFQSAQLASDISFNRLEIVYVITQPEVQ